MQVSHRIQLAASAVAASLATAGLISAYQSYSRRVRRRKLEDEIQKAISEDKDTEELADGSKVEVARGSTTVSGAEDSVVYDETLIREQLARNYAFFGEEGMAKIRAARVVIVGCGGVGSWAAIMLARSGVTHIRLVDFDYVTLSSLNRHATATLADVGTPKVRSIERTLSLITKWIEIDARIDIWKKEEGGALLESADWVIDAIDNITTKVDLLKYCHDNGIKIFSSMGAGAKCDPTRIQISDISNTIYDPLARSVRRRLRLQGVNGGIPVVYSTEVPGDVKLLPLPEEEFEKGNVKELGVFDDFRVRILPVLGPLPSIFGLHAATYILCDLAAKPILNPLPIKNRHKLYERLSRDLLHREGKITGQPLNKLPIDEEDISFIFEDLHRGRSVVPPHPVPARPALARWDPREPLTPGNCVVLEHSEMEKHVQECLAPDGPRREPTEVWGEETTAVVARRAMEAERRQEWFM